MSIVAPPDCDVAIFNPACFDVQTTTIGGGVNIPYLFYPTAQGDNTMLRTDHLGVATFENFAVIKNIMYDSNGLGGNNGDVFTAQTAPFPRSEWSPPTSLVGGALVGSVIPVVIASDDAPEGYLWCDGTAYLETDYPDLYAVIGLTYTFGQPAGYFMTPFFSGRTPIGSSATGVIGTSYGNELPVYGGQTAIDVNTYPPHTHNINWSLSNNQKMCVDYNKTDNTTINNTGQDRCVSCNKISLPYPQESRSQPPYTNTNGTNTTNQNYTADHYNPFVAVNWLIKT
jgi:microcystin-dependent protein